MLSCWIAREEGMCFCPPYPRKPSINLELVVYFKIYIGFWSLNQEKKSKSKPEVSFLWLSRAGSFPLLYSVPCHSFFGYTCHWWQFARTKFWQVPGTWHLSTANISDPALLFSSLTVRGTAPFLLKWERFKGTQLSSLYSCILACTCWKKQAEHAARFLELLHILGLLLEDLYQY